MNEPGPMNIGSMFQINEGRYRIYTNANGVMMRVDKQTGLAWVMAEGADPRVRWIFVEEPAGGPGPKYDDRGNLVAGVPIPSIRVPISP